MKRNYLISVIVMGLIVLSLYSTYAMFTSSVETNDVVSMDTVMNYTFKINGTQELTISSKSKLRFNAIIQNDMTNKISYGLYYKMFSPTTLPSGVTIAEITDSNSLIKGQLNQNSEITIPIIIENSSENEIKVEIGVVTGYATETQGVAQLVYDNGKIPITDIVNPSNITGNSCSSTLECNEECEVKEENGKYIEYCNCTNGNEVEAYVVSLNIINGTSDYLSRIVKKDSSTTFTVTPNSGYEYESLSCIGGSYDQNTKILNVSNVTSTRSCTIKFKKSEVIAYEYIESLLSSNLSTMNNDDPDGNVRYMGANPNNYVRFNDELWRIIGVFNIKSSESSGTQKRVKLMRVESLGNMEWATNNTNEWGNSTLQTYLNGDFYNSMAQKDLIENAFWNLGGIDSFTTSTASLYYSSERGTTVYEGHSTYWIGKIGLMYPSDYGYATSGGTISNRSTCLSQALYNWKNSSYSDCINNDFLYNANIYQWTITPFNTLQGGVFRIYYVSTNGEMIRDYVGIKLGVFPVVYLKSTVKIINGDGTLTNPYALG